MRAVSEGLGFWRVGVPVGVQSDCVIVQLLHSIMQGFGRGRGRLTPRRRHMHGVQDADVVLAS